MGLQSIDPLNGEAAIIMWQVPIYSVSGVKESLSIMAMHWSP